MKKHLIYLGYTGTAHRIALFDENDILRRNVPVKDVAVLSDDLEFLNCKVIKGKPYPNLMGAKVICSCPKGVEPELGQDNRRTIPQKDLWAFPDIKPDYLYFWSEAYGFSSDIVMRSFYEYNFWDGMCKENYYYAIGAINYSKTGGTTLSIDSVLCMTHTGSLFFLTNNTARVLEKAGAILVQVGTPELYYPNPHEYAGSGKGKYATVGIPKSEAHKVIWVSRKGKEMDEVTQKAEYIWWSGGSRTTICDFRRYTSSRVFGVSSCASDASVVILPETTEEIWLGMFYECASLKVVYIPKDVSVIHELGLPPRRFKNVTLYTSSPLVVDFCKRSGVAYKPCASADDMLADFYAASDTDSISVSDASSIAALGGSESDKAGETGTLWSAIRFSYAAKGIATEELQRRYPVVETCDYPIPQGYIENSVGGNADGHGEYGKERCRTLAAAFTQFYPLFTGDPAPIVATTYKFRLGDYNLYVIKDVLNLDKLPPPNRVYMRDFYMNHHIALLEDTTKSRVIHRFMCTDLLYSLMCNLAGVCALDQAPSGALRYAGKLPAFSNITNVCRKDVELKQFNKELFNTLLPIMYGTTKAKLKLTGIDLHTGNLVNVDFVPQYCSDSWGNIYPPTVITLNYVSRVKSIKVHPEETHIGALFAKDCVYNKK